jgi:hypothetical protein
MGEILATVIGTLAAGALAKAGELGGRVVSDAYDGLKSLIVGKLGKGGAVQSVEDEPDSQSAQATLAEAITKAGLASDSELVQCAEALKTAIEQVQDRGGADIKVGNIVAKANVLVSTLIATGRIQLGDLRSETGDVTLTHLAAGVSPQKKG